MSFSFLNCYNKFPLPIILIVSLAILCVCKFHLSTTFHYLDFSPESQPVKSIYLPKFGPEILPKCLICIVRFIYITKVDCNMYLSKHS